MRYSLRNFLIVFILSVLLFSVAAVFLINYIGSTVFSSAISDSSSEPSITGQNSGGEKPLIDGSKLSFLVLGLNEDGEADHILMICINKLRDQFMISSIPSSLRVSLYGGYQKLGHTALSCGVDFTRDAVYALTAVQTDYLIVFDADGFSDFVDLFGGFDFQVPQTMRYSDPARNLYISLDAGAQHMSGAAAVQFLRYADYANDATVIQANNGRALALALFREVMTTDNLMRASDLLTEMYADFTTDMTSSQLSENLDTIFNFSRFSVEEIAYPGTGEEEFFLPDTASAKTIYMPYR